MSENVQEGVVAVTHSSGNKRWYVVHAYSGMEKSVQRALTERIMRAGMEDKFGQILVPTEEVIEVKKVVWPTRKEATQITAIVFVFVLTMALFLWGADKLLEFLLYNVILGWK